MRTKIMILLGILIFVQGSAQAVEYGEKLTRVAITSSDAVKYESEWLDNPPRVVIKFKTQNVFGRLIQDASLNEGVIKNITVDYYPDSALSPEKRQVRFLTFWLNQKTDYKVWDSGAEIFVDFKGPASNSAPKQIEISSIVSAVDINSKNKAADDLLAKVSSIYDVPTSNAAGNQAPKALNSAWLIPFLLIGIYFLWVSKPKEASPATGNEYRKWWRHDLSPLKDKSIYMKLESREARASLGLIPKDIGYGGLSFECSRLKRLKGILNLSIFTPGAISPVELKGNIAWQKNSRNIFRKQIGVSFVNPPEKDWARIHHYIEEQYAALKK